MYISSDVSLCEQLQTHNGFGLSRTDNSSRKGGTSFTRLRVLHSNQVLKQVLQKIAAVCRYHIMSHTTSYTGQCLYSDFSVGSIMLPSVKTAKFHSL